jgi:ABC-2 type transport system permease protein/lipopolysaccharide transport system permease protein
MTSVVNRLAWPTSASQNGSRAKLRHAILDFRSGLAKWRIWVRLGWNDILRRYRRSILGPFWLTVGMGVMVLIPGVLYARLFQNQLSDFLPFLCVGLLLWTLISGLLVDGGVLFTGPETYIRQLRLPYSLYVYRLVWSKLIVFAHNAVIYVAVLLYFRILPGPVILLAIPGLLFILLNGALAALLIGMVSARFRDIPQAITSSMQIVFFITPILWKPELLSDRRVVDFNPLFHLIEVAREPLLGHLPALTSWLAVLLITLVNLAVSGLIFARYRSRISYWV